MSYVQAMLCFSVPLLLAAFMIVEALNDHAKQIAAALEKLAAKETK